MARAAGWQFLGNILRVGLGLAASVLIVRWLGAVEFGKASWILSLTLYFSILGNLGLGTPFTRHLTRVRVQDDRAGTLALVRRMVGLRLAATACFTLLYLLFLMLPASFGDGLGSGALLVFVPILLGVSYLHGLAMRILQVFFQQRTVMLLTSLEIVIKVAAVGVLGGSASSAGDLLAAAVLSEFLVLTLAAFVVGSLVRRMSPTAGFSPSIPRWRELLRAGRAPWLLSLAERVLGREVDVLLLGILAGPAEVSRYALPFSLATLSISLAGSVFQSTTNLAAFTEASPQGRRHLLRVLLEYWMFFVLPLALGGMMMGDRLLRLLYGETAGGVGLVPVFLFAAFALYHLAGQVKDALQGCGDDRRPMRAHLIGGGVNLVLSILWIPAHGAQGAALATLLGAVVINLVQWAALPSALRVLPRGRSVLAVGVGLGVMALVVRWLGFHLLGLRWVGNGSPVDGADGGWALTLLLIAMGAGAYFLALIGVGPHSSLRGHLPASLPLAGLARRML